MQNQIGHIPLYFQLIKHMISWDLAVKNHIWGALDETSLMTTKILTLSIFLKSCLSLLFCPYDEKIILWAVIVNEAM